MKHIKHAAVIFAAMCLLSDCITPYDLKVDGFADLLVVEGVIVDGETTIKLSRSMPLDPEENEWGNARPVSGANVWIEAENGDRFDALESVGPGEYIAPDVRLVDDLRYRLRITSDGEEYESDWRLPQSTPPIESMDFHLSGDDGPLQVRFNVYGEADRSRYYLWSYEETWEIFAYNAATHYFGHPAFPGETFSYEEYFESLEDETTSNDLTVIKYPNENPTPYYYCWKYNRSKELLLASTDLLAANTLKDHVLYEIGLSEDRLSSLYHTKVLLYSIGQDTYYYYSNQRENTDQAGSIFAPIPSEMMGNIVNTTSPGVPVIGFVDVSRRVAYDIFLDRRDSHYRPPYSSCITASNLAEITALGRSPREFYLFFFDNTMDVHMDLTLRPCLDCREIGGSKIRPSWWPNNHY